MFLTACTGPLLRPRTTTISLEQFRVIDTTTFEQYQVEADEPAPDQDELAAPDAPESFADKTTIELTIQEARAAALEHNLDLKVALVDPAIANLTVSEEEARFESSFNLVARYNETDSPTSTELESAQAENLLVEPSLEIPLRTGGSIEIALPMTRGETNNEFATLNPAYTSDLRFSLAQSLLRNAGLRVNTAAIRIATYDSRIATARTRLAIITQLSRVDRTYWQLARAWRALEVARQQYELADAQLERAKRRVKAGAEAEIEIIRAQSGLSATVEDIIIAQNTVLLYERQLKALMHIPGLGVGSPQAIKPVTPPDPVEYEFDAKELADTAVKRRVEVVELEMRLLQDAINIHTAENQLLPLLDLSAAYEISGLGSSMGDAFDQLSDTRFRDWSLGFVGELPLGNKAAKSRYRRAILTRLQRLSTRQAREQSIRREVYDAIDVIEQSWRRILAARQAVILAARTLDAEQRQFDVGLQTSTEVLDAAAALAEAQLAEIQALTDYQIAQVDLAAATGTLLGAARIRWAPIEYEDIDPDAVRAAGPPAPGEPARRAEHEADEPSG